MNLPMHRSLLVASVYIASAVLLTWPLALYMNGFLLYGGWRDVKHSDYAKTLKTMADARDALYGNQTLLYLNKRYDHPEYNVTLHWLYALLSPLGLGGVFACNLMFLLSLCLSGASMYLLAMEFSGDRAASLISGLIYMSSNYTVNEYLWGHYPEIPIQWLPLIFLFLERTLNSPNKAYPILLGLALSLQVYSGTQYALYLSFTLPAYVILRALFVGVNRALCMSAAKNLALSAATAVLLAGYYAAQRMSLPNVHRTLEANTRWYWVLRSPSQLYAPNDALSLGAVPLFMAACGAYIIWSARKNPHYRRYLPFAVLFAAVVWAMMGPYSAYSPYYLLYTYWPLVHYYRVPSRLFPFALMCVSLMSAVVLTHLGKAGRGRRRVLFLAAAAALAAQTMSSVFYAAHHIYSGP